MPGGRKDVLTGAAGASVSMFASTEIGFSPQFLIEGSTSMTTKPDRTPSEPVGEWVSIFQRGTTWYANYQLNGRQNRPSLKTDNKKTAIRRAREIDQRITEGQNPQKIEAAQITEVIAAYKDSVVAEGRSKKTKTKYWAVLTAVETLATEMGRSSIMQVDLAFVDRYRSQRAKNCRPITVYHEIVILKQFVKFAITRRMAPRDPLALLKMKRPKPAPQPYFDEAQLEQIHSAARPPHRSTFLLLAETGLRIGEAKWLTWADVDFAAGVIHIRAKDDWQPKTGDERAVPMTSRLHALLSQLPRKGRWVLTAMQTTKHPLVGRQIDERRALAALKRVLAGLGLKGKLHSFRHSFISRSLTRGVEEPIVRSWVGHVDPAIMRLYTHISSKLSQERIKLLE
jgi:integrase